MAFFKKESLEVLRQRIDLVDLVSSYVDLRKAGSAHKGLCPFHDEKSPSFVINPGDRHYHCYGCGAHGDAIEFLMNHLHLTFFESVELLAQRFQVTLEYENSDKMTKGPNKKKIRQALSQASRFYHYYLLHSEEGRDALNYLYSRGICLEFIKKFRLGLAPSKMGMMEKVLSQMGFEQEFLELGGLLKRSQKTGRLNDFFTDRILFPILDPTGLAIGFSSRKFKESTFGGKYVNSPETPVFKKSRVLFGLHAARREIAKQRKVLIVEGQIDALRLNFSGFPLAVATQGTAFAEGHLEELLRLGVTKVYLAFDADSAGKEAAYKAGDLFQKKGIEVFIVSLPENSDPDSFLLKKGLDSFLKLIEESRSYLEFAVDFLGNQMDLNSPAGKTEVVKKLRKQIETWEDSIMVYESLKRLFVLLNIPLDLLENKFSVKAMRHPPELLKVQQPTVQGDAILEKDLLRLMFYFGKREVHFLELVTKNLTADDFFEGVCQEFFKLIVEAFEKKHDIDAFSFAYHLEEDKQSFLKDLMQKKIYPQRAEEMLRVTVLKILERNWLQKREEVAKQLKEKSCPEEKKAELLKEFGHLSQNKPALLS
jgi:DNA primase